jgi:DNA invertase Pin-like site-specific DNA recombinase
VTAPVPSAGYARCSTTGQSVDVQVARLRETAPGIVVYADVGLSGSLDHRPEFDKLRASVERGGVSSVYVTKLDRLGRSARSILEFFDLAERNGVRVVVTDQGPIDTLTPVGRLVRTVLAAMAELEADLIRERTRDAMAGFKDGTRKTRSGKPVGRPRILSDALLGRIRELRETPGPSGKVRTWNEIARMVHSPAGSCKKWYCAQRGGKPRVINPDSGFLSTRADP